MSANGVQPSHTDHPLRHFDRTCPACIAEHATARNERGADDALGVLANSETCGEAQQARNEGAQR